MSMETESSKKPLSIGMTWKFSDLFADRHNVVKESVVRDKLALERTYLAWVRTGLVMLSLGVAFLQFDNFLQTKIQDKPEKRRVPSKQYFSAQDVGTLFVLWSPVVCGYATVRYFRSLHLLANNRFNAAKGGVLLFTAMVGTCTLSAFQLTPGGDRVAELRQEYQTK